MRLLAWDTSSKTGALAAIEWREGGRDGWAGVRLAGELALNVEATHSERLLWAIDQLLKSVRWELRDIDVFGVGVGPGSFTGLRIGVTTARTLAHTLKKPLVGVSSLAALARPAALWASAAGRGQVLVVASTDACKGELFALWGAARTVVDCVAQPVGDLAGLWKRGAEEKALAPDALAAALKKKLGARAAKSGWLAVGEGRTRYEAAWKRLPRAAEIECPQAFCDQVQGRYVAMLAWEGFQAGLAREALQVHPRYARAADAELKLKAGLLPPGPTRTA